MNWEKMKRETLQKIVGPTKTGEEWRKRKNNLFIIYLENGNI